MSEFSKGQKIKVVSGGELEIIQKLGEGGQGIVYKAKYNGKDYALKQKLFCGHWRLPSIMKEAMDI